MKTLSTKNDNSGHMAAADSLLKAWHTNHRVTIYLIENLPRELWSKEVPGTRRTVQTIAAHIHNARCMWIKMLGERHSINVPARVEVRAISPSALLRALAHSDE